MEPALSVTTAMIKDLVAVIDDPMDEAIIAHGFSFSALTADHGGARLCYVQTQPMAGWRLIIESSPGSAPALILERGSETKPAFRLQLTPDGGSLGSLTEAMGIAMTLFNNLDQA